VQGKRTINTRFRRTVTIREDNAAAALEVMSRFAVDPRWLIYLPPTMSPSETCTGGDFLEHPAEAFAYYRRQGMRRVMCQEKHMGSRAVVVVCRDSEAAERRFGIESAGGGRIYTRTGRPFFGDSAIEEQLLARLRSALDSAGIWDELKTSWVCLDAELMPWSLKAQELLRAQYAAVGSSARHALADAVAALDQAGQRDSGTAELLTKYRARAAAAGSFVTAYRRYCWPVTELSDCKLAPFHLLASEGRVYTDHNHTWHMKQLARICSHDDELLRATSYKVIDLTEPSGEQDGISWWEELTEAGGEGIVVKPLKWLAKGRRGLIQPAVKCRGRQYLRITYGPEYTAPENLERLRKRGLSAKRSLAMREYTLGLEALHRFVAEEPLYRVHECVFGVLALESEPVDPRL
ncbi:MAG: polynucleotide kinase-phosphatase, partial [Myxococcota bacterium]